MAFYTLVMVYPSQPDRLLRSQYASLEEAYGAARAIEARYGAGVGNAGRPLSIDIVDDACRMLISIVFADPNPTPSKEPGR